MCARRAFGDVSLDPVRKTIGLAPHAYPLGVAPHAYPLGCGMLCDRKKSMRELTQSMHPAKLRVTTNSDMCVLIVPSGSKPAKDSITLSLESQNVRVFVGFEIILTLDRLSAYND